MKYFLALLAGMSLIQCAHAADAGRSGIELDALPWLTGGYYLSGWYGKNHLRYRAVVSDINVPDSFTEDGFKDYEITAYALIVDYFPHADLTGLWYGAGIEYWQSRITNETDQAEDEFNHTIFTLGLGYVWPLTESVYLNPWGAVHIVTAGDEHIAVGNRTYQQDTVVPSASIKLGWQF